MPAKKATRATSCDRSRRPAEKGHRTTRYALPGRRDRAQSARGRYGSVQQMRRSRSRQPRPGAAVTTAEPDPQPQELTIDELARAVGMTVRNVRAYASRGLMPPPRLVGRTGYYGEEHVTRLTLVRELLA